MGFLDGWFGGECELVDCRVREDDECEGEEVGRKGEMRLVWKEMKAVVGQVSE